MSTQMIDRDVFEKIRYILTEALGVDDEDIVPKAILTDDLGAESIDYIDIHFRVEKVFSIRFELDDLFMSTDDTRLCEWCEKTFVGDISEGRYVQYVVTEVTVQKLRLVYPHLELPDGVVGCVLLPEETHLFLKKYETVGFLCRFVTRRLCAVR